MHNSMGYITFSLFFIITKVYAYIIQEFKAKKLFCIENKL